MRFRIVGFAELKKKFELETKVGMYKKYLAIPKATISLLTELHKPNQLIPNGNEYDQQLMDKLEAAKKLRGSQIRMIDMLFKFIHAQEYIRPDATDLNQKQLNIIVGFILIEMSLIAIGEYKEDIWLAFKGESISSMKSELFKQFFTLLGLSKENPLSEEQVRYMISSAMGYLNFIIYPHGKSEEGFKADHPFEMYMTHLIDMMRQGSQLIAAADSLIIDRNLAALADQKKTAETKGASSPTTAAPSSGGGLWGLFGGGYSQPSTSTSVEAPGLGH